MLHVNQSFNRKTDDNFPLWFWKFVTALCLNLSHKCSRYICQFVFFFSFSQLSVYTIAKLISCIDVVLFDSFISIKCNILFGFLTIFSYDIAFTIIHDTQHITQTEHSVCFPAFNYLKHNTHDIISFVLWGFFFLVLPSKICFTNY